MPRRRQHPQFGATGGWAPMQPAINQLLPPEKKLGRTFVAPTTIAPPQGVSVVPVNASHPSVQQASVAVQSVGKRSRWESPTAPKFTDAALELSAANSAPLPPGYTSNSPGMMPTPPKSGLPKSGGGWLDPNQQTTAVPRKQYTPSPTMNPAEQAAAIVANQQVQPYYPGETPPSYAQPNTGTGSGGSSGGGGGQAATYEETPDPNAYHNMQPTEEWTPPPPLNKSQSTSMVATNLTPTVAAKEEPKGIFRRIWEFFFGPSKPKTAALATAPVSKMTGELENVVASLVKRARAGDQNAMAMIVQVRENRYKVPAASRTFALLERYIAQNPVTGMNGELTITHGDMTIRHEDPRIKVSQMSADPRVARSIYALKMNEMKRTGRVSAFDRVVGWELGE